MRRGSPTGRPRASASADATVGCGESPPAYTSLAVAAPEESTAISPVSKPVRTIVLNATSLCCLKFICTIIHQTPRRPRKSAICHLPFLVSSQPRNVHLRRSPASLLGSLQGQKHNRVRRESASHIASFLGDGKAHHRVFFPVEQWCAVEMVVCEKNTRRPAHSEIPQSHAARHGARPRSGGDDQI